MNPWDTKFTHELSEREMLDYVYHMEHTERFYELEQIDRMVEHCVEHWRRQRELRNSMPMIFHEGPTRRGYIGEYDTLPEVSFRYRDKVVKTYPWMDEKHVRYLARMQIEEQWES